MVDVYVGLGSNLGERLENLARAAVRIAELPVTRIVNVSRAYESEAWGVEAGPPYANAVIHIRTDLYAHQLLELLKDIEAEMGREPSERNAPRVIDLDILLVGDEEWWSDELVVPHPRLLERDFVVTPLLEVEPDVRLPDGARVTNELAAEGRVIGELGPIPGLEEITGPTYMRSTAPLPVTGPSLADLAPGDEWVLVAEVPTASFEGDVKLQLLRGAGIPAELSTGADTTFAGPYMGVVSGEPLRILVPRSRLDEARGLLAEHGSG